MAGVMVTFGGDLRCATHNRRVSVMPAVFGASARAGGEGPL